jgi:hypothetical protein
MVEVPRSFQTTGIPLHLLIGLKYQCRYQKHSILSPALRRGKLGTLARRSSFKRASPFLRGQPNYFASSAIMIIITLVHAAIYPHFSKIDCSAAANLYLAVRIERSVKRLAQTAQRSLRERSRAVKLGADYSLGAVSTSQVSSVAQLLCFESSSGDFSQGKKPGPED